MSKSDSRSESLDEKIKAIEERKNGERKSREASTENSPPSEKKPNSTWKILSFILLVVVLLLANVAMQVIEHQTGMRLSRMITFVLPIGIGYFVIFKLI